MERITNSGAGRRGGNTSRFSKASIGRWIGMNSEIVVLDDDHANSIKTVGTAIAMPQIK